MWLCSFADPSHRKLINDFFGIFGFSLYNPFTNPSFHQSYIWRKTSRHFFSSRTYWTRRKRKEALSICNIHQYFIIYLFPTHFLLHRHHHTHILLFYCFDWPMVRLYILFLFFLYVLFLLLTPRKQINFLLNCNRKVIYIYIYYCLCFVPSTYTQLSNFKLEFWQLSRSKKISMTSCSQDSILSSKLDILFGYSMSVQKIMIFSEPEN